MIEALKMSILTLRNHLYKAIRPSSGFTVDEAPTSSAHTAELFAQVRNNGDTRIVLGGNEVFDATFKLGLLVDDDDISNWSIRIQQWPRDLRLRKGLLSSLWTDLSAVASARDAEVTDAEGAGGDRCHLPAQFCCHRRRKRSCVSPLGSRP